MAQAKNNSSLDLTDAVSQSEAFILKNRKLLIAGIVAIIVIVGGAFAAKYLYFDPRSEKADTMLALGETYFETRDYEKALNGDGKGYLGYVKIADQYGSTDAGNLANLYAGLCYAQQGKTKEAIKFLEAFDTQDDVTISPAALSALANCYATDKQLDKAVETFKKAAELSGENNMAPICLKQAAEILESQNKKDEALRLYQEIKDKYMTSITANDIDKYIERVSK